ncbi:hypothetical protein [Nigerium massiliense]|uniref:hypothetical protein n=1 Tax=Nigerium massiliense TaxID=1522317 RepID=UPI00058DA5DF|nr:hypothetical protein [Nigerium massiliense]
MSDTHVVTTTWQATGGPVTPFGERLTVDCPPLPSLAVSAATNCTAGKVTATLPLNATHAQRLLVNGVVREELKAGQAPTPLTVQVQCGPTETIVRLAASVQRTNGLWNPGDVLAIAIPAQKK